MTCLGGKKGSDEGGQVTFLLWPFSQTPSASNINYAVCPEPISGLELFCYFQSSYFNECKSQEESNANLPKD